MNPNEPSSQDILDAISHFSTQVDERFNAMDQRFDKMDQRFDKMDQRFDKMDQRFDKMDSRVGRIEATMVTKEYLDDKLTDLQGNMTVLIRKEDHKLRFLVDMLKDKHILSEDDVKRFIAMEPFPQLA